MPSSLLDFSLAIFSRNILRSVLRPFTMATSYTLLLEIKKGSQQGSQNLDTI